MLAALRDETGESAQLYVRDGDHRVCVAAAERPSGLRDTVPVGRPAPARRRVRRRRCCWPGPIRTTGPTAWTRAALRAVRQRGWAASVAEREAGVASVSAPVRDRRGSVDRRAERERPDRPLGPPAPAPRLAPDRCSRAVGRPWSGGSAEDRSRRPERA